MNIVWFKRDLRIHDHPALIQAVQNNKTVLPLYILEPELWKQPDLSHRQYRFLIDCLNELDADLKSLGQGLIVKVGDAVSILRALHAKHTINALFSHQETWNGWTYERDKAVLEWTKENNIPWHEPAQNGVIRRLKDRDGWASRWYGESL
jgi:deoxyribodipyrimidine photo-lyase